MYIFKYFVIVYIFKYFAIVYIFKYFVNVKAQQFCVIQAMALELKQISVCLLGFGGFGAAPTQSAAFKGRFSQQ